MALVLFSSLGASWGDVRLASIFGDHMVLQQNTKLPVWGTAEPGEEVIVTIGTNTGKATADSAGKWKVLLEPMPVTKIPVDVKVVGKNTITLTDVLIGDVWLCSGQSNMEFGIGNAANAAQVIPQLNLPEIRMFIVGHNIAFEPQADVKGDALQATTGMHGRWVVCTPQNAIKIGGWNGFSAVGLLFALEIYQQRQQPLGLIGAYWGGTPLQNWISEEALQKDADLAHNADEFQKTKANFSTMLEDYKTKTIPQWQKDHEAWKQQVAQLTPGTPRPKEPARPQSPDAYPRIPAVLFNGMIHPLIPYALKGVLWYQGESNGGTPEDRREYAKAFATMIGDWRQRWGQGDFPFLYVQLPGWNSGYFWITIREAQLKTLALPATGMAIAIDLGEENDVHPKDKTQVAHRLALAARRVAYGEELVYSGPIYSGFDVDGGKIRLRFTQVGSGLTIGGSGKQAATDSSRLTGFEIAGSNNLFQPAEAKIDGDTVIVWSDAIPKPKSVRYAHAGFPKPPATLYNKEGLPASPFNTITLPSAPATAQVQGTASAK